jgi:hypothetical protein
LVNLLELITELRSICIYWLIINDTTKDIGKDMQMVRDGRRDTELPHPLLAVTLQELPYVQLSGSSQKPFGFLW